jgi:hypothetical protein
MELLSYGLRSDEEFFTAVVAGSGMTIWRLQRRHLISTPPGTSRAKRLPHSQRIGSAAVFWARSFFIDRVDLAMLATMFLASIQRWEPLPFM